MLREIIPEIDTSKPGQINSKEIPSLTTAINLDLTSNKGFYTFEELCKMPGSDDYKLLEQYQQKQTPHDPVSIMVSSFLFFSYYSLPLAPQASQRQLYLLIEIL
jgi:hypothetical protein